MRVYLTNQVGYVLSQIKRKLAVGCRSSKLIPARAGKPKPKSKSKSKEATKDQFLAVGGPVVVCFNFPV
ncbi:MAG: hypothetical protein COA86_18650 [Kangiella sp.]|nr:MAG: hypothetical protein COA86_18650 [Kangiella sp.]